MVRLAHLYVLVTATLSCKAQQDLLPLLADTSRQITSSVLEQPLVQEVAQDAGVVMARTVYDATLLPIAITHALGVPGDQPILINDNVARYTDKILADFQAGLGNEDASLSIDKLITKYGHPVEKHDTVTEDGYALRMFRIPGNGSAVFLMHGLLGSADDFVIAGPESSLAYLLAQEGYDVWIGNARGNKHSRRHVKLNPSGAEFWNFSWHEIGYYDLPAMVDYVLNTTKQKSLKYIGHSQGTTSFFVMGSERPEYNDKIALMIALSPGAFMSRARSPLLRLVAPVGDNLGFIMQSLGLNELLPDNTLIWSLKNILCGTGPIAEIMCYNPMLLANGFGFAELNVTNLPVILGHTPAGAALKQALHYGQNFNSGDFKQYDYGALKNLRIYGSEIPPSYSLQRIRAPVSLFYSDNDWMAHPDDVDALYQRLGNPVDIYKVPHQQFNHLDFIWAKHFRSLIFNRIRKLLAHF